MSVLNEAEEWLDKEPRADGKPRRWRPFETITVDLSRVIFQEEHRQQHQSGDTQPHDHTNKQSS
jgi:hypothetical protein